jgi:hypothetical protein
MKVFCIGANKTGTTSMFLEFHRMGLKTNKRRDGAPELVKYYLNGNFDEIIKFCEKYEAFQDVPFSLPNTYKYLHESYPDAKFILTLRDSPDVWYGSLIRHYSQVFGKNGKIPTKQDLKNHGWTHLSWMWELNRLLYDTPEEEPYQKDKMIEWYNTYNKNVIDYFKDKENFLVLNLKEKESYKKFTDFLEIESPFKTFLHANRTQ